MRKLTWLSSLLILVLLLVACGRGNNVEETVNSATDATGEVAVDAADAAGEAADAVAEAAEGAADSASEVVADAAGEAADAVAEAAEGAVDAASEVISGTVGAVGEAADAVSEAAEGAVDAASEVISGTVGAVGEAADAVSEAAEGAVDAASEVISGTVGAASEVISDTVGTADADSGEAADAMVTEWVMDPDHSEILFSVRHMMLSTVRGQFDEFSGTFNIDAENPANSQFDIEIQAASVNTRVDDRDTHLRSPDFFDAETYPTLSFVSKSYEVVDETTGKLTGDLTIKDITKEVVLDVVFIGEAANPFSGQISAGFNASTVIDRTEWDLTWNQALETGGVLVGDDITIDIQIELLKQNS